ncbi:hypothetical protein HanIR_Chr16g0794891 [Helianthus annuus]|nr:hypothetical protein HanIR_Chr16g0794891 [Helianthus annuus]
MEIQISLILDKSPNKRDTFKILKKILFMGNRNFSGKTGYRVADSPACPDILRLPLRREPGKMGYIKCQTSDKISLSKYHGLIPDLFF